MPTLQHQKNAQTCSNTRTVRPAVLGSTELPPFFFRGAFVVFLLLSGYVISKPHKQNRTTFETQKHAQVGNVQGKCVDENFLFLVVHFLFCILRRQRFSRKLLQSLHCCEAMVLHCCEAMAFHCCEVMVFFWFSPP